MRTGVRQGCVISSLLSVVIIDLKATSDRPRGLEWELIERLEDAEFADDISILSHSQTDIEDKTDKVGNTVETVGLKIHPTKTKLVKLKTFSTRKTAVSGKVQEEVIDVKSLGGFIAAESNIEKDGSICLQQTQPISGNPQLCAPRENIQRTNKKIKSQLGCFVGRITDIIKARRWSFIGHILRFENTIDYRIVMNWTNVGKRSIGRPNETWRRMVEKERVVFGWKSWAEAAQRAADRAEWPTLVHAICDTWRPRDP